MSAPAPALMATNLRSGSANSLLQYDSDESSESSLSQQGSEHAPTQINYYSYLNYMMIFLVAGGLFLFCSVMMGVNFYNNFVNIMHLSDYNLLGFVFELAVVTLVAVTAFELAKDIKSPDTKGYFWKKPDIDDDNGFSYYGNL